MPEFKELPNTINGFKIIKDLGFLTSTTAKQKYRSCIAICPRCNKEFNARPSDLRRTKSCLCSRIPLHLKGMKRLRSIFKGVVKRCYNKNSHAYERYGLKGIIVCDEWLHSTASFLQWAVDNGYSDSLSIDRIDNSKGYYPDNCRWAADNIQIQNSSKAKLSVSQVLEIRSKHPKKSYAQLAIEYNVNKSTIACIITRKTWSNI